MCGLTGWLSRTGSNYFGDTDAQLRRMGDAIRSRGPDSAGTWFDLETGIGLCHRRLAVVDLTEAGHQPMMSHSGRYVIVFNGEIYNHLRLREALPDGKTSRWRGHSDTETLLAGFEAWGVEKTLKQTIGMFAIALWDRAERTLLLARDRVGEKPLYYGWQGQGDRSTFLFGSELSALRAHPSFHAEIDRDSLSLLLRYNCIGGTHSIFKGIKKLSPGCFLKVSLDLPEPIIHRYWSSVEIAQKGVAQPFTGTAEDAVDTLEILLKDAISQQMMADVPLGAFLSGGIDSSTVVALMQSQTAQPVKTFTIGFNESNYNEAEHAKAVALHLGTQHTDLYVTPRQVIDIIPQLPSLYCEPFADASQIPTFLVSKLARQHVTVSLSGDAGDELFCGYNRYQITASTWEKLRRIPQPLRRFAGKIITSLSPTTLDRMAGFLPISRIGDKLHKGAGVMASTTISELYQGMTSYWPDPASVVINSQDSYKLTPPLDGLNDVETMMALDLLTYLPDDILTKVDRAAMGVSLESRVPFLDHRIIEFAWSLPLEYKLRHGITKWPLRQILYKYVPQKLIERPKIGFGIPIGTWLRGPLREWSEDLLAEDSLKRSGIFDPKPIRLKLREHMSGRRNWQDSLWSILMFQSWLLQHKDQ